MKKEEKDEVLRDWARLNVELMSMTEAVIGELLEHEKKHRGRLRVMLRLYHRLSKVRGIREKAELAKSANG